MVEKMKNQELITNKKPLDLQIKNGIKYFPVFVVLCVFAFFAVGTACLDVSWLIQE